MVLNETDRRNGQADRRLHVAPGRIPTYSRAEQVISCAEQRCHHLRCFGSTLLALRRPVTERTESEQSQSLSSSAAVGPAARHGLTTRAMNNRRSDRSSEAPSPRRHHGALPSANDKRPHMPDAQSNTGSVAAYSSGHAAPVCSSPARDASVNHTRQRLEPPVPTMDAMDQAGLETTRRAAAKPSSRSRGVSAINGTEENIQNSSRSTQRSTSTTRRSTTGAAAKTTHGTSLSLLRQVVSSAGTVSVSNNGDGQELIRPGQAVIASALGPLRHSGPVPLDSRPESQPTFARMAMDDEFFSTLYLPSSILPASHAESNTGTTTNRASIEATRVADAVERLTTSPSRSFMGPRSVIGPSSNSNSTLHLSTQPTGTSYSVILPTTNTGSHVGAALVGPTDGSMGATEASRHSGQDATIMQSPPRPPSPPQLGPRTSASQNEFVPLMESTPAAVLNEPVGHDIVSMTATTGTGQASMVFHTAPRPSAPPSLSEEEKAASTSRTEFELLSQPSSPVAASSELTSRDVGSTTATTGTGQASMVSPTAPRPPPEEEQPTSASQNEFVPLPKSSIPAALSDKPTKRAIGPTTATTGTGQVSNSAKMTFTQQSARAGPPHSWSEAAVLASTSLVSESTNNANSSVASKNATASSQTMDAALGSRNGQDDAYLNTLGPGRNAYYLANGKPPPPPPETPPSTPARGTRSAINALTLALESTNNPKSDVASKKATASSKTQSTGAPPDNLSEEDVAFLGRMGPPAWEFFWNHGRVPRPPPGPPPESSTSRPTSRSAITNATASSSTQSVGAASTTSIKERGPGPPLPEWVHQRRRDNVPPELIAEEMRQRLAAYKARVVKPSSQATNGMEAQPRPVMKQQPTIASMDSRAVVTGSIPQSAPEPSTTLASARLPKDNPPPPPPPHSCHGSKNATASSTSQGFRTAVLENPVAHGDSGGLGAEQLVDSPPAFLTTKIDERGPPPSPRTARIHLQRMNSRARDSGGPGAEQLLDSPQVLLTAKIDERGQPPSPRTARRHYQQRMMNLRARDSGGLGAEQLLDPPQVLLTTKIDERGPPPSPRTARIHLQRMNSRAPVGHDVDNTSDETPYRFFARDVLKRMVDQLAAAEEATENPVAGGVSGAMGVDRLAQATIGMAEQPWPVVKQQPTMASMDSPRLSNDNPPPPPGVKRQLTTSSLDRRATTFGTKPSVQVVPKPTTTLASARLSEDKPPPPPVRPADPGLGALEHAVGRDAVSLPNESTRAEASRQSSRDKSVDQGVTVAGGAKKSAVAPARKMNIPPPPEEESSARSLELVANSRAIPSQESRAVASDKPTSQGNAALVAPLPKGKPPAGRVVYSEQGLPFFSSAENSTPITSKPPSLESRTAASGKSARPPPPPPPPPPLPPSHPQLRRAEYSSSTNFDRAVGQDATNPQAKVVTGSSTHSVLKAINGSECRRIRGMCSVLSEWYSMKRTDETDKRTDACT